ncbi:hypothetical protein GF323_01320 [Candidatus Woesearchaeota archaeon]|nr:hypothetical protein [Candidatus Woesearchaeota archaeon]
MFETEYIQNIRQVLNTLKETHWRHQRHKIKNIAVFFQDLLEIDKLIKTLHKKFQSSLQFINSADPEATSGFYQSMYDLTERLVQFLQLEDSAIDKLNLLLKEGWDSGEIEAAKNTSGWYEDLENQYSRGIRCQIIKLRKAVRKANKRNKAELLKGLDDKLKDMVKHLKKMEKYISFEKQMIHNARKPLSV